MSEPEQWRAVPGYEGRYEVSDRGRVRSIMRRAPHVLAQTSSGRHHGYLTVELRDAAGRRRNRFVHGLVIWAFRGEAPSPAHRCAHDDGDNHNNALRNLLWKTMQENMDDRERHGRTARGERHGKARMTEAQARQVIALLPERTTREIARTVGVSIKSVEAIRGGIAWTHLK